MINFIKPSRFCFCFHAFIIHLKRDERKLLIKFITRVSLLTALSSTRRFLGASNLPRMHSDDVACLLTSQSRPEPACLIIALSYDQC